MVAYCSVQFAEKPPLITNFYPLIWDENQQDQKKEKKPILTREQIKAIFDKNESQKQ